MAVEGISSPSKRAPSPAKTKRNAATPSTAVEKITVFVATCQLAPFDVPSNSYSTTPVFKQVKFTTLVLPTATLEDLRFFLMSQWAITKSPYAQLPVDEQFYTFKGRILRLDGTLDGSCAVYRFSFVLASLTTKRCLSPDIANNDTIYLRFASLGKVLDPWAMSTSELRVELKTRNAYETKLHPEQLMMRLVELTMRESRMQRLQIATKREQEAQVTAITKELAQFQGHGLKKNRTERSASSMPFARPATLKWPHPPSIQRTVFLSITQLEHTYQGIPRDVLGPAILVFDAERKWVFDKHNVLQKNSFDYRYMCFDSDFLELLTLKEEMGLVFWFRPQKSYEKLSNFFESIDDPLTQKKYAPLLLKESKWLTLCGVNGWEGQVRTDGRKRDTSKVPQFTRSVARVTTNLASQSFDYIAVQELLFQSNATLLFAPL